jgi:hypothetical protein
VTSLADFWSWLENLPLAGHIGESWWFPLLESLHVLSATFVLGTLLMVDLRLLGVAAGQQAVTRISGELIPWSWGAFAVAVVTGIGMFITRAGTYMENPAFQIKLVLLALAGINMAAFHFGTFRRVAQWDLAATPTVAARFAGAASLVVWAGVMLAGRWVGHLQ